MKMRPVYWIIGPLGVGLNTWVESFPEEDRGCFSESFYQSLVWDGSIVAKLIHNLPVTTKLFGNNLGESLFSGVFRKEFQGILQLREVGDHPNTPPIDLLINTFSGTRTWVSSITPPPLSDLLMELTKLQSDNPLFIYCDYWKESGKESFDILQEFTPKLFFLNIGDCNSLQLAVDILNRFNSKTQIIAQTSIKETISLDLTRTLNLSENKILIVTQGHQDLFVLHNDKAKSYKVKKIDKAFATGAGAIFSASVIRFLHHNDYNLKFLDSIIEESIETTRIVLLKTAREYIIKT